MSEQSNIIPFPKQQSPSLNPPPPSNSSPKKKSNRKKLKFNASLATTVCSLIAIALATGVSNTSFFQKHEGWVELSSLSPDDRSIASVEPSANETRNAAWEKSVAESLASTDVRDLASVSIGHEASEDEQVRFGVLERKYTILRDLQRNEVESITLQGSGSEPSMVLDRAGFLGQYGHWISDKYGFSKLKSTGMKQDHRVEEFTLFDTHHKAFATAQFELDNYQRLLSFHLQPL